MWCPSIIPIPWDQRQEDWPQVWGVLAQSGLPVRPCFRKQNKQTKLHNNNRALCIFGCLLWWAGLDRVVLRVAVWPWWWQNRTFGSGFQKIGSMVFRNSSLVISTKFYFGLLDVNEWGAGRILHFIPSLESKASTSVSPNVWNWFCQGFDLSLLANSGSGREKTRETLCMCANLVVFLDFPEHPWARDL